ncbi:hypothetical protein HMF8227_00273 [Saliniradius amylolyticus]|uniref:MSHA biogenesis protein MshJ n=1 Tax=Saliniradius amylolyticus TaxID=2183582 RepID=A0A2S2DZG1_9ALTE|nr:type II secretion system protein M [Saliniradius amylolyticus]AWL10781.1 hypothetical protein HMF8227_00273 [Saliniradius amylolyticus]
MKYWHKRLSEGFMALKERERKIVIFASAFLLLYLGFIGWIEPGLNKQESYQQALTKHHNTQRALESELKALGASITDPDASLIDRRKALQKEYEQLKQELSQKTTQLIPADRMRQVLSQLLQEHEGVSVLEVTSMPVSKLSVSEQVLSDTLYQRGFTIKMEGQYFQLQRYLADMELLPWELYWRRFDYRVTEYPTAQVTLELYTLSTNASFLGV